jgi:hypothetical protein
MRELGGVARPQRRRLLGFHPVPAGAAAMKMLAATLACALLPVADAAADTFACSGNSIRVFADDAGTGFPAPLRILQGDLTGISECYGIALDLVHDELWVANGDVLVFGLRAEGNVAPRRRLPAGSLGFISAVTVDVARDEVLLGSADGRIHAFSRLATGGAPKRTIDGTSAGVATIVGLAVDMVRDEVLVTSWGSPYQLTAFARTATGAAPAVRPPLVLANNTGQIAAAADTDEWYITSGGAVLVTRAGVVLSTFSIGYLEAPFGLDVRGDGQVLAGDRAAADPDPIKRFAAPPTGNAPPIATIFNGSAAGTTLWGVASSLQPACGQASNLGCLFRDGFE